MATKAFESGKRDGLSWCNDLMLENAQLPLDQRDLEEGLNAPGKVKADEGLINACTADCLAKVLGLSTRMVDARGARFSAACDEYNRGWDAAVREAIADREAKQQEAWDVSDSQALREAMAEDE